MVEKELLTLHVDYLQVMDESANVDESLMPTISDDDAIRMYRTMVLSRVFDKKLLNLQRSGRLGTLASSEGQEACQVPAMMHLTPEDWLVMTFRENPALITRGVPMTKILQYWGGDERGSVYEGDYRKIFPVSIPIASQNLHAVGLGMANNILGKTDVSIVYFGDGATSQGDFHEGLNYAVDFNTPTIFICQNNQFAISLPRAKQTKSKTIAQKGVAFEMPSIQVDGNDPFAVYKVVGEAVQRARQGKGPSFIECFTYRMGHHTTSDDSHKYRQDQEVEEWRKKDPIKRLKQYLMNKNLWDESKEQELYASCEKDVEQAVVDFEKIPVQDSQDMFRYMYKEMPWHLEEQRQMLREFKDKH